MSNPSKGTAFSHTTIILALLATFSVNAGAAPVPDAAPSGSADWVHEGFQPSVYHLSSEKFRPLGKIGSEEERASLIFEMMQAENWERYDGTFMGKGKDEKTQF